MRPTDIARVARECGVRTVVLTHYPAETAERTHRLKEVQEEFTSGTVIAGDDLMTIEV
jgi:ribonuclease BN (tRNA processing enzyme)